MTIATDDPLDLTTGAALADSPLDGLLALVVADEALRQPAL